jgi:hypothetical protein
MKVRLLSMTRALPFTQASLRRAIEAVRKSGLRVRGVRPDGTLIVQEPTESDPVLSEHIELASKWRDIET